MNEPATKPKAKPKVTAFVLDGSVVGDVDAHPFAFGGFPGLWQVGRPTLASALGITDARMRELIDQFNLPLVEVKVNEKDAHASFPADPSRIPSGPTALDRGRQELPATAASQPDAADEDTTEPEGETV